MKLSLSVPDNFTRGGMTGNYELNAGLYQPTVADMTRKWFERMWADSVDTKADLIKILECSKFGTPPPPTNCGDIDRQMLV